MKLVDTKDLKAVEKMLTIFFIKLILKNSLKFCTISKFKRYKKKVLYICNVS